MVVAQRGLFRFPGADYCLRAFGLNGQKIYVWPAADIVVVVLTQYQHFANQGYVLDLSDEGTNFPNTCSARNSCPGSTGSPGADL